MSKDIVKKHKFTSVTDYKYLECYFEEMSTKGYMLIEAKKGKFTFEKCEPKELDFNVNLFYPDTVFDYPDEEKSMDFRKLCENNGWTYCTSNQLYQIFYKNKNDAAKAIHKDSNEEYKMIKNVFMKTEFISMMLMMLIIFVNINPSIGFDYENLFSNSGMISIITPIFLILINLSVYLPQAIWFIRNKTRVHKGEKLWFASAKAVFINSIITWTLIAIYFIYIIYASIDIFDNGILLSMIAFLPVIIGLILGGYLKKKIRSKKRTRKKNIILFVSILVLAIGIIVGFTILFMTVSLYDSDFNKDVEIPSNISVLKLSDFKVASNKLDIYADKDSSILVPISLEYSENLYGKYKPNQINHIETRYIQCRNNDIANYIFEEYVKDKEKKYKRYNEECMDNQISKIDNKIWNVEKGYYLNNEKSSIIIKKDNIIYVLDGDLVFSRKDIISICKEKLDL
ncbi:MAG: DUF2812 domain-containing protein [Tepidibacter sp.]|uniref:DUF2812 domain-containing protein n=1 Tax=Tepidibacter sp. TaxID=2529387 RepID=UPI0025EF50CB|nr:DUF2812 domain-containing protein [Tepidibacter sp.]MCT4507487.1 DUF2812 domain-containing protein [Tepidibacter sp.]